MSREKTIGILVARMGSGRLPGKALRMIGDKPLLAYGLERLKLVQGLDEIWLATTQHPSDDKLALWAIEQGIQVFQYPGEIDDVMGRISAVLAKSDAERFVLVLGDCPFVDSRLMTHFVSSLDAHPDWDCVEVDVSNESTVHCGVNAYRTRGWRILEAASTDLKHREHAGSILKEQPDLITRGFIQDEPLYYGHPFRLSVDTLSDLNMVETVVKALGEPGKVISLAEVITYLAAHPDVAEANLHVHQKTVDETSCRVMIAVQAGETFGTGHLVRCQTLARVLEEYYAANVLFWLDCPTPSMRQDLIHSGRNVIAEEWSLSQAIRQYPVDKLVIDFRDPITPSLIQSVRMANGNLPIVALDNNGMGAQDADAIVFPNAHALPNPDWEHARGKIYEGPDFTLLGPGILYGDRHAVEDSPLDVPTVLVTMGGTDPGHLTEMALNALKELKGCHIDLVVPPHYPNPENLEKIATQMPSTITLHWKVRSLYPLMKRATIAVSAFGVTAYELAYMGVPALLIGHYPENEADMIRFEKLGTAFSLGWGKQVTPEYLFERSTQLLEDAGCRRAMSERGKALLDDRGAQRVAQLIIQVARQSNGQPVSS